MATGFYAAASGMLMQQRVLNVLGNNMSNNQTPGYKTTRTISSTYEFDKMNRLEENGAMALMRANRRVGTGSAASFQAALAGANVAQNNMIGKSSPVRIVHDVPTDFESGSFEETGRPFDMAIDSAGFFNISVDGQNYMTRNGNFDIDKDGYLILRGHGRVQGAKGDIQVGGSDFIVESDGTIYRDKKNGSGVVKRTEIDKLLITSPNEGTLLTVRPDGLYQIDPAPMETTKPMGPKGSLEQADTTTDTAVAAEPGVSEVTNPSVLQSTLETSNVDLNREMSMIMESQRNFQSCSKALQMIDALDQKTASIGAQT